VLEAKDPELVKQIDAQFAAVDKELNQHQDTSTGEWASYDTLSKDQVRALSDAVAALSEPISRVAAVVASSD
jgi:iron uptake system component EfeO